MPIYDVSFSIVAANEDAARVIADEYVTDDTDVEFIVSRRDNMPRTPQQIIDEFAKYQGGNHDPIAKAAEQGNLGWDGTRIGKKVSNGPRRTPSLEINGILYPMHEADVPCPVCHSHALDGQHCGATTQCMEEGCGRLYPWHDFASRCEIHDGPGVDWFKEA